MSYMFLGNVQLFWDDVQLFSAFTVVTFGYMNLLIIVKWLPKPRAMIRTLGINIK